MGKLQHWHRAAVTAAVILSFTSPNQLQANQNGIFVPYIPQALPFGEHTKPQRAIQRRPAQQQGVQFQRAAFTQQQPASPFRNNWSQNAWDRVTSNYQLPDYSKRPRVAKFVRSYARNSGQINTLSRRADTFLHMIIEEINRRGMPAELALLPFVESGFDPDVFSHAGAAGLWQFIPSTGRNYGLKQTRTYDARMDPFAATGAALNYLQKLHREFKGDWLKALAAYNCGENCVHRAVRRAKAAGRSDSYWDLSLPRETMNYVPRLLAFQELIGNASRYGIRLPVTPNDAKLTQVQLNKPVNLRKAAVMAGLPANKLTQLNPCFRTGITTPQHSNRIILPREHAARLIQVLRRMPPA